MTDIGIERALRERIAELESRLEAERIAFFEKDSDQRKTIENREARLKAAESNLAEFTKLVTVEPGTVSEDVNAYRELLRKSMYLTRKESELRLAAESRLDSALATLKAVGDRLGDHYITPLEQTQLRYQCAKELAVERQEAKS